MWNNDKLFWPGEISQEYGSYIKPYTLDLTYSGEKLAGKTVNFKTEDSETGTLTLNDVIPGENTTPINDVQLNESGEKDAYTFNGTSVTETGAEVKYSGRITPKAMQLSLEVTMAHYGSVANTYVFPAYSHTTTEEVTVRNSGASYVNVTAKEENESIKPIILQIKQMGTNVLDVLFPYILKDLTLERNGLVTANYTTSSINLDEIIEIANANKTDAEFKSLLRQRTYVPSPIGLAYWNQTDDNSFVLQLNIPAIISLITQNNGQEIDNQLIIGIGESLIKSDPVRLKLALSALNTVLNNQILTYILKVDDVTFTMLMSWLKNGIPMEISQTTKDHTYIYFNKESLTPFVNIISSLLKMDLKEVTTLLDKMEIGVDLTIQQ
ncbi:DUF4925 domain-containing protein [Bacteroides finegoldii]|uniref:DUF4925 domain-containing protein n=1 Tax=Bacteroides finegoldii TaxID=338188 RepID=UPI003DA60469